MAWVEKEVGRLDRKQLREVAAAASVRRTRHSSDAELRTAIIAHITPQEDAARGDVDAAAKYEELRLSADIEGMAWVEKKVKEQEQRVLRKVAQATGERVRSGRNWLPVEDLQKIEDAARGDVDAAAKLEELRLSVDIEGMAWMEKEVEDLSWDVIRKEDAASGDVDAAAKLEELRLSADIEGMAWVEKEVEDLSWDVIRKVAQATGERVRSGRNCLPVEDLRKIVVTYCTPQAW
eukprot:s2528_g1.t1